MASNLSLTTRKNLKDNEPKLETHLATIQKMVGIKFEVEVDWMAITEAVEAKSYKDRAGEIVYDWYMKSLATNITDYAKDPIQKESFVEAFQGKHTIQFILQTSVIEGYENAYCWTRNNDGVLEAHIPKAKIASNTGDLGKDLAKTCSGDGPMSVLSRKNIADQTVNLKKHMKTIAAAVGFEMDVECDWPAIVPHANARGYVDRVGEVIYNWYLGGLAAKLTEYCKDPIQKESFIEMFGSRKCIQFFVHEEEDEATKNRYVWTTNNGGALAIHAFKNRFCSNTGETGADLAVTCSGDAILTVICRKDIKDKTATLQKHMKTIKAACGFEMEVEVDWEAMAKLSAERGYKDRVGEVVYSWYIGGIASNLTDYCKDPIQKESFVETFGSKHVIQFQVIEDVPEQYKNAYCWTSNKDGVLVANIPVKRCCSNVSDLGKDFAMTCSGDGPMSVLTRKNIADQTANLKKHMKTITTACGFAMEIECDWPAVVPVINSKGYADRAGEVIYNWYIGGLASKLENYCKDPIQKESFVEMFGARKTIQFVVHNEPDDDHPHKNHYVWTTNNEGVLVINFFKNKCCTNTSDTGADLAVTCSGDAILTVPARKNIKDQEAERKKQIARITKACGFEMELEIDWEQVQVAATERGYKDRIGEMIFKHYLSGLADNLEKLCKDEMGKEAFAEACSRKALTFKFVPKDELQGKYVVSAFDNGTLVILTSNQTFCTNTSECGRDIEKLL